MIFMVGVYLTKLGNFLEIEVDSFHHKMILLLQELQQVASQKTSMATQL